MNDDTSLPQRRSIRMRSYDYAGPGTYFLTLCTQGRVCLFGDIRDGNMQPNDAGRMIEGWWRKLAERYALELDIYVVMPNHVHGIIFVPPNDAGAHAGAPLQQIVRWFKTMTTNEYIRNVKNGSWRRVDRHLWQRNYYEHVIRDDDNLLRIREYIANNPRQWALDKENPDYVPPLK